MYSGGRKRGAAKSPAVQAGPPNGSNTASKRTTPRHRRNPQSPPPRNTPNKHATEPKQPTRTSATPPGKEQPDPNTASKTSHPQAQPTPPEKNCSPHDTHPPTATTAQQGDGPNQEPQHTMRPGQDLRRGLRGGRPTHTTRHTTQEPGPATQTPPPTRHPNPKTQPRPETQHQIQDPHHPPTTPPPTPHQVPCTHAMGHIQPTPTLANKLEQTQETSPRKSKLQMRRP